MVKINLGEWARRNSYHHHNYRDENGYGIHSKSVELPPGRWHIVPVGKCSTESLNWHWDGWKPRSVGHVIFDGDFITITSCLSHNPNSCPLCGRTET